MRRLPALLAAAGLLCCRCAPATSTQALVVSASSAADKAVVHREAFVTFVVSEDYVLGARVLGQSLRESGTQRCVLARVTVSTVRRSRPPRGAAAAYPRPAPGRMRARRMDTRAAALTRRC